MKILIVSDTHGKNNNLRKAIERVSPIDLLIHLGDYGNDEDYIEAMAPCPVEMVAGNNDFSSKRTKDLVIRIGKYIVMLTHGHRYGVNYNMATVSDTAKKNGASIVMFGHTHIPMIDLSNDVWLINPGSLSQPRQYGRIPTFIIMELDAEGEAHFTLNHFKDDEM